MLGLGHGAMLSSILATVLSIAPALLYASLAFFYLFQTMSLADLRQDLVGPADFAKQMNTFRRLEPFVHAAGWGILVLVRPLWLVMACDLLFLLLQFGRTRRGKHLLDPYRVFSDIEPIERASWISFIAYAVLFLHAAFIFMRNLLSSTS